MTRHFPWALTIAFLFIIMFPAALFAAAPVTPFGLCIETPEGIQCADTSPATTNPNIIAPKTVNPQNFHPGHYMFVGRGDGISSFDAIKGNPDFIGVKKVYLWKDLEVGENVYDFSKIESDLSYLQSIGKRLWVELTITEWNPALSPNTPRYMWSRSEFGGSAPYYSAFQKTKGTSAWRALIWNTNVQNKLIAFYAALGNRFNTEAYFEGVNLGETSIEDGPGWSPSAVENAFKAISIGGRKAFPSKTVVLQPNWGPPDPVMMRQWLTTNGIGFGIPDVVLDDRTITQVFPDFIKYHIEVPTGTDVQWDNYERYSSALGRNFTSAEILDGTVKGANPWYMFWEKRDPYFIRDVIPAVRNYGPLPAAKAFYNSLN